MRMPELVALIRALGAINRSLEQVERILSEVLSVSKNGGGTRIRRTSRLIAMKRR
jgi:hypothetical protein